MPRLAPLFAFVLLMGCGACGGGGAGTGDAGGDGDGDPGLCGAELSFVGEFLDWNSTSTNFCGIHHAIWQVRGDAARKEDTPPNGRVEICLQPAAVTPIDITVPSTSPCGSVPGTYTTNGVAFASQAVIQAAGVFSVRTITDVQAQQLGITLDPSLAHVFVHVDGAPRRVTSTNSHDGPFVFNGAQWAAGDTGQDVFFPNTVTTGGATTIQVASAIGAGSVPLTAGLFSYITVVAN